jgi:hypothetical protein
VERGRYYTDAVKDVNFFECRIWYGAGSVLERTQFNIVR